MTPERVDGLRVALLCSAMTRVEALHAGAWRVTAVRSPRVTAERRAMVFGDGRFRRAERDDDSAQSVHESVAQVVFFTRGNGTVFPKRHRFVPHTR